MSNHLQGGIDKFDRASVQGWVRAQDQPDTTVSLLVSINNEESVAVRADTYRADLEQAGIGNGRYGFVVDLGDLSPFFSHTVRLVREDDGTDLPGSPLFFKAEKPVLPLRQDGAWPAVAASLQSQAAILAQEADRLLQLSLDRSIPHPLAAEQAHARWAGQPAAPDAARLRTALVVVDALPMAGRNGGALISHMQSMRRLGFSVSIAPASMRGGPAAEALETAGLAPCVGPWFGSVEEVLRRAVGRLAAVILHGHETLHYLQLARHYQPQAKLVYSVGTLEHLRLSRLAEAEERPGLLEASYRVRTAELSGTRLADRVVTYSATEATLIMRDSPNALVQCVPPAIPLRLTPVPFDQRQGVVFPADFAQETSMAAAWWLVREVMPLVHAEEPSIPFILAGTNIPDALSAAAARGVRIISDPPDLATVLDQARLTVLPTGPGAAASGVLLDSLAAGLPLRLHPGRGRGSRPAGAP